MYPAVLLMYFISAAVILLASLALIVQVSLPYNTHFLGYYDNARKDFIYTPLLDSGVGIPRT
jgi:hypothetical protein